MGPNTGLSPNTVKTALDAVYYPEFDLPEIPGYVGAENPIFFKRESIDRGAYITEQHLPAGKWDEHEEEEEIHIATIRTDNKKTHTVVNYKKALKIPVEYFEDEMHNVVQESVRTMAMRARTTKDDNALDLYADGFATHTTSEGAYVWSNSHTTLSGDTVDNLETGVFNASNLETLFRSLVKQKAQDGELGSQVPVGLLVALNLFEDAQEVTKSELKSGTGNNDLNYFSKIYPGLTVGTSAFLNSSYNDATNVDTSYYLVSRNHSLKRFVRQDMVTNVVNYDVDDRDRYTYKGRFREVNSWISYEGAAASQGTV